MNATETTQAARKPLSVIPREKVSKQGKRYAEQLESLGFTVTFEGRGCFLYARVWRGPVDLSGQLYLGGLSDFLNGALAMNAIKP